MIKAKKGNVDANYFKNIIQRRYETEKEPPSSGVEGSYVNVSHIYGWFLDFFAYWGSGEKYIPFKEKELSVNDFDRLPKQMLTVPFKIKDKQSREHFMKYTAGFIGCDQNEKNEVYPVTGWIVSPSTQEDLDSSL